LGVTVFVMLRLFCVEEITVVLAVLVLLFGFGSGVEEDAAFAELVITVPDVVAAGTNTVNVNVVEAPEANDVIEHVLVPAEPTFGVEQVGHAVPVCAPETKVVVPGVASVKVTFAAAEGPLFFTTIV